MATFEPSGQRVVTGSGMGMVEVLEGHPLKVAAKEIPFGQVILPAGGIGEQGLPLHQPEVIAPAPVAVELHQYLPFALQSVSVLGTTGQTELDGTCELSQQDIYPAFGDSQQVILAILHEPEL